MFCALTSVFCAAYMAFMGYLISIDYPYVPTHICYDIVIAQSLQLLRGLLCLLQLACGKAVQQTQLHCGLQIT